MITGEAGVSPPQDAFEQLYRELWWPMLRLAAGLVDAGAAEDIVQDAFAALHRKFDQLRDPEAAAGYLRTSVVNTARSVLRRRRTARVHLHALHEGDVEAADAAVMLSDEHRLAREALATLPDRQREVLTMRYLTDCSDEQIAQATGLSRTTVRSTASRGLASLRSTLGGVL